jgi:hypothetical protein
MEKMRKDATSWSENQVAFLKSALGDFGKTKKKKRNFVNDFLRCGMNHLED